MCAGQFVWPREHWLTAERNIQPVFAEFRRREVDEIAVVCWDNVRFYHVSGWTSYDEGEIGFTGAFGDYVELLQAVDRCHYVSVQSTV